MGIGKNVAALRAERGWTLEDLEEKSEVAKGTIHAIEARDSARSKYFPALAKAFGITMEQLAAHGDGVQGDLLGEQDVQKARPEAQPINGVPAAAMQLIALMAEIVEPMDDEGRSLAADAFAALLKNPQNQSRAALALAGAMANDAKPSPPSPTSKKRKTGAPGKTAHARSPSAPSLSVKTGGGQQLLVGYGIRPLKEVVLDQHAGDGEQKMYRKIANYPKASQ